MPRNLLQTESFSNFYKQEDPLFYKRFYKVLEKAVALSMLGMHGKSRYTISGLFATLYKHLSVHAAIFLVHPTVSSRLSDSWRGERALPQTGSLGQPAAWVQELGLNWGSRLGAAVRLPSAVQHLHSILGKGMENRARTENVQRKKAPQ